MAVSSRYVRVHQWAPDPDQDEAAFVDFLLSLAPQFGRGVLFPTDDGSLMAVSKHKERLQQHFAVVAEDWRVVRQLLEKARTYEIAHRCGVLAPRVRVIDGEDEALVFAREIGFPCIIKPSVGHTFFKRYGVKMLFVNSIDELKASIERLADYSNSLMLSEFIPGDDACGANYNSFYVDGVPCQEFTAQKLRLKPTGIGFPTAVVSRHLPEVIAQGRLMIGAIGYRGYSCTEFKRDPRDNKYKLMEVNARHNYSGMLALTCGRNFPYSSYRYAIGQKVPASATAQTNGRYWVDEERDIIGLASAARLGYAALGAYVRPYLRQGAFAVFSCTDPLPAARLVGLTLRSRLKTRSHQPPDAFAPSRMS
jgi:D-aspartate ligase